MNDQCIPEGDLSKAMEFDRGDYIAGVEADDFSPRKDLDLALRDFRRQAELRVAATKYS